MREIPNTFLLACRIDVDERDFLRREKLRQRSARPDVVTQIAILATKNIRAEERWTLRVIQAGKNLSIQILAFVGEQILEQAARALSPVSNSPLKIRQHAVRARLIAPGLSLTLDLLKRFVRETEDSLFKRFVNRFFLGDAA